MPPPPPWCDPTISDLARRIRHAGTRDSLRVVSVRTASTTAVNLNGMAKTPTTTRSLPIGSAPFCLSACQLSLRISGAFLASPEKRSNPRGLPWSRTIRYPFCRCWRWCCCCSRSIPRLIVASESGIFHRLSCLWLGWCHLISGSRASWLADCQTTSGYGIE